MNRTSLPGFGFLYISIRIFYIIQSCFLHMYFHSRQPYNKPNFLERNINRKGSTVAIEESFWRNILPSVAFPSASRS